MEWFILALLAALFHAVMNGLIKHYLKQYNKYLLAGGVILSGGILLSITSAVRGLPFIQEGFWMWLSIQIVLFGLANIYYYKALDIGELSLVMPMLAFTPVFMLVTSFLLLKEFPSTQGLIGLLLIVIGSYVINFEKSKQILLPFQKLYTNKGVRYMLIVAFLYSITGNVDKILTLKSNASFAGGVIKVLTGLLFLCWVSTQNHKDGLSKPKFWMTVLGIGIFSALITLVQFTANTMTLVPYVVSVKRISILFSILIGYFLFKEQYVTKRLAGGVIMVIGTYLILMATV